MDEVRNWNRKNIKNYIEIYIKSDLKNIINKKKKRLYHNNKKNIVGIDIKPEYPKNPDIVINNDFKKNLDSLSKELIKKLKKTI